MTVSVEIVVPNQSEKQVRRALKDIPRLHFATPETKPRVTPDLVIAALPQLDVNFRDLLPFIRAAGVRVVLLAYEKPVTNRALQALARLSSIAKSEPYVAPDVGAARRLMLAREAGAEGELIASASIEDDELTVWSCEPNRYTGSISEIPALASLSSEDLVDFTVSPSGSRIHWNRADVDLNLDTFRELADPDVRQRHERAMRERAARLCDAIRSFRQEVGLKQSEIPGLTERQVRRLEEGEVIPHMDSLRNLAQAHGLSVDVYLGELASRSHVRRPRAARTAAHTTSKMGRRSSTRR
jgi:hypothetical protein